MTLNIRNKIFETNSSSTHAISIFDAVNGMYDTIIPDDNGIIELGYGEFGWQWDRFNDALTKANYAAIFIDNDQTYKTMLVDVIKDHTGAKEIFFNITGSIDHQSSLSEGGDCIKAFSSKEKLKNWIFHPESWLFTGNDNGVDPPNFFDVEFGKIYNYEISIESSPLTEKFEDFPDENQFIDLVDRLLNKSTYITNSSYILVSNKYFLHHDIHGFKLDSFSKLKDRIIILYKQKYKYTSDGKCKVEILDTIELKLHIKKI